MRHPIITICLMVMASAACACGAELLVPSQFPTIQLAVNAAAPGDTVILADGTYTGPGNTYISINKAITIRSANGPETCIIDCNSGLTQGPGFKMTDGTLAGLTIKGGLSSYGGAVYCDNGRARITNCILTNNKAMQGGAVFCRGGIMEILNCSFIDNSTISISAMAGPGGAIYCENGSIFIANSTIFGNSGAGGGGIYCAPSSNITIKNCKISENSVFPKNSSNSFGGGIYSERGSLTVIGSQISRNTASTGAGIYCIEATTFFISDCNIEGNIAGTTKYVLAELSGGGIYFRSMASPYPYAGPAAILNSSITDNLVNGINCKGGGLYIETSISPPRNINNFMLSGCVVTRNRIEMLPNQAPNFGGGLYCKGQVRLLETEVTENLAFIGGGIYNTGPGINMSRCRISGNFANYYGNAIFSNTGEIVLESCVVSNNQGQYGQAIRCEQSSILKIANSTIVGNNPPAITGPYSSSPTPSLITNSIIYQNCHYPSQPCKDQIIPGTISISYSDVQGGYPGTGNIDTDPCFVQTGHWDTNGTPIPYDDFWVEGDYRLTAVSPCIDTGGVAFLMDNKDLAGNPRITGASLDMGAYEYQNSSPIAEAGPEQVAYAWIDSIAAVTLDGSASRDADGDELSYLWNWSIDGNNYQANGVSPAIELPVGQHRIELIVNDGLVDSRPDDVNVTVIGPVEGRMWTVPRVINRYSWQPYILAMLKLPEGITKEQIDPNNKLLLYPGGIEAIKQHITQGSNNGHQGIAITGYFDKASLLAGINGAGPVQINVVGQLTTGQYFFGQDKIWIINPRPQPKLNLMDK